jgi:hypothetical protein
LAPGTKALRPIDERIVVLNYINSTDATLALRIAVVNNDENTFLYLWNNFIHLYSQQDLIILVSHLVLRRSNGLLSSLLNQSGTSLIFRDSTDDQKQAIRESIASFETEEN